MLNLERHGPSPTHVRCWRGPGNGNGFQLQLTTTNSAYRNAEATFLAEDWAHIGVRTRVREYVPTSLFYNHFGGGDFQVALWAYIPTVDPLSWRDELISECANPPPSSSPHAEEGPCTSNWSLTRDAVIDQAFTTLENASGMTAVRRIFDRVQAEINRKAHWIPLYLRGNVLADDGRVEHLNGDPSTAYAWTVR